MSLFLFRSLWSIEATVPFAWQASSVIRGAKAYLDYKLGDKSY